MISRQESPVRGAAGLIPAVRTAGINPAAHQASILFLTAAERYRNNSDSFATSIAYQVAGLHGEPAAWPFSRKGLSRMRVLGLSWGTLVAVVLVAGSGCGRNKPVPVSGVVTLDGTPVAGAIVQFIPEGGKGNNAQGMTGPDGSFQLTTQKPNDGAFPGTYKAVVQYQDPIDLAAPAGGMQDAFAGFEKAQKVAKKAPKYVIPPRYSDPAKTELKYTVPTEGRVEIKLTKR